MSTMSSSSIPWKRISAEFVAITAAVYLGLLADSYRDYRIERSEEQEYLRLLERDLDRDLEVLETLRANIEMQAQGAQFVHNAVVQPDASIDDLERAFSPLFLNFSYEQQRTTFLGLRDGAELKIIRSRNLRSAISDYYDVHQEKLQNEFMSAYIIAQQRLRINLGKYLRFFPVEVFSTLGSLPSDLRWSKLVSPVSEFKSDIAFMNDIAELGARGIELVGEIEQLKSENRELRDELGQF
jgi:hypothetical protein